MSRLDGDSAEQNKDRIWLIAATIHELKTFLTAIKVSAELLEDELKLDEKSALGRLVQSIVRNARSIDERLIFLSEADRKPGAGFGSQLASVEAESIIRDTVARFHPIFESKKQTIALDLRGNMPKVKGNKQFIEQILSTLLSNAGKFSPQGGQIKISSYQDAGRLIVQVADNGIGIPREEQDKIFQPHYRNTRNIEKGYTGNGIGLATAKLLVELQGGKIWLESAAGRGSSFSFSLPMAVTGESSRN